MAYGIFVRQQRCLFTGSSQQTGEDVCYLELLLTDREDGSGCVKAPEMKSTACLHSVCRKLYKVSQDLAGFFFK